LSCSGASRSAVGRFRPGMPLVVRLRMRSVFSRILSTTRRKRLMSWLPRPVSGSRTWMWTIDAPACQASMADWAISSGVMGMYGAMSRIMRLPVMAAVMMTFSIRDPLVVLGVDDSNKLVSGILEREVRRVLGNRSSRSGTSAAQTV